MTWFKQLTKKEQFLLVTSFLMLLVFVLHDQFVPPFILLFVVSLIPFFGTAQRKTGTFIAIALIVFYLLHVISLFYSQNLVGTGDLLMTKFSLFLFPALALFVRKGQDTFLKGLKWGLIVGAFISMSFCLIRFAVVYLTKGEALMASKFALNMHTSYQALVLIVASILFFYEKVNLGKYHWIRYAYVLLALITIVFLRSMGAIVCLALIFTAVPLWYAFKEKRKRWLLVLPIYGLLLGSMIYLSPELRNDVNTTWSRTVSWMDSPNEFLLDNKNNLESNTVRLAAWTIASKAISENPMGVGIGDKWDALEFHYRGNGYTYYVYKKLNIHNQFLESGLTVGIFGMLLLLFALFHALRLSWKKNLVTYFLIFLSLFASLLFESMLDRSVGVILLGLMTFMLIQSIQKEDNEATRKA